MVEGQVTFHVGTLIGDHVKVQTLTASCEPSMYQFCKVSNFQRKVVMTSDESAHCTITDSTFNFSQLSERCK